MLLSDGIACSGAPIALLRAEEAASGFDQLLRRTVLYRLCIARLVKRQACALDRRIAAYEAEFQFMRGNAIATSTTRDNGRSSARSS
jgi:hypothetical protein